MSQRSNVDACISLALVGDSGVGKTCLTNVFADGSYNEDTPLTVGVDFKIRTVMVGGQCCKIHIWDMTGQERFRCITNSYYRAAKGILIAFDTTNRTSFDNVEAWLAQVRLFSSSSVQLLLVGTKTDLMEKQQVTKEQAAALAKRLGIPLVFTSAAKDSDSVDAAFSTIAKSISQAEQGLAPTSSRRAVGGAALANTMLHHSDDTLVCCSALFPRWITLFLRQALGLQKPAGSERSTSTIVLSSPAVSAAELAINLQPPDPRLGRVPSMSRV